MSKQYDLYLEKHRENVNKGFEWMCKNMSELIPSDMINEWNHDASKNNPDEYEAYDAYFYGNNRSYSVVQKFNMAWLLHIHRNPHHWQYWILVNDNPDEGEILIPMPTNYIVEMICDWWAFSWAKGNLKEIFNWYDEHKDYMKLHSDTRKTVESILEAMKIILED